MNAAAFSSSASEIPSIDPAAIRSHVEMLHGLADGVDGILTLTRICARTEKVDGTECFAIGDVNNMVAAIEGWSRQPYNLYAPWSVFRTSLERGSKGKEIDVVACLGLVGDLDADNGKPGNSLPLPAPYVIETSEGNAQPVFPFSRALPPQEAKPIAVALSDAIGADTRTQDVCGLWRIPGTLNWATKKKLDRGRSELPQQVRIKQAWTGELVEPEAIWEKVSGFARQKKTKADDTGNDQGFNDLKARLKKLIASPAYPGEDESETAASVFTQLFWLGWSDEQIEAVVLDHSNGIGARYINRGKDLQADIARTREKFDKGERSEHQANADTGPVHATPYVWRDPATIPMREWLYGRLLIRKFVTATVAPGGVGKSSLITVETLAMVSGKDLLDISCPKLRVWLWNLEDPREETERKIQAAALHYGLTCDDLADRLCVDSGRDQPLVIATTTKTGAVIMRPVVDNIVAAALARQIDVLIIDPFVSCHEVSENDNSAMDMVAKELGRVADRINGAVHLVHHTRKMGGIEAEVTTESSRGGKAFTDACRVVRAVNRMSKEEGERAGVENHRLFFRTFNDKANLAPPVDKSNWFKLENVDLGNGPLNGLAGGDEIGVVTTWQWPDPTADITGKDFEQVAAAIRRGRWRKDVQAKDWVGVAAAQALNLDPEDKADKARVASLVKFWIKTKALTVVTENDEKSNPRPYVRVTEDLSQDA